MQTYSVSPKQAGMRLDQFLVQALDTSRKKVKRIIDQGKVFMGGRRIIIASWELQAGEKVELREEDEVTLPRRKRYLKVYFEDRDIIVVEKPAGVACERTAQTLSSTLVDDINDYLARSHPEKPYPYLGLMHRLDRETSGLMVYTLSKAANRLSQDFKRHKIQRRYLALVEGALKNSQGRVDRPLIKDTVSGGKKMKVLSKAKPKGPGRALTDYLVKERFKNHTLVEARLLTGRTHQVRVHMAFLGHPIYGDQLYGSKKAGRHLLHANFLEFHHPITGKKHKFSSPLPKDFQKKVEALRKKV